jgi:hypothetical protein
MFIRSLCPSFVPSSSVIQLYADRGPAWLDVERVRTRCDCFLEDRRPRRRSGRVPARAQGRCRRYRWECRTLRLHRLIPRTRHSLKYLPILLSRQTLPTPNIQAPPTLISPYCITPPPSTPPRRPRPSHSSTRSALLQGLRNRHHSFTSGLHSFRLHRQGRKFPSTWRDTMRESQVWWGAPYSSGSAYATRHWPPASPNEFSTPLTPGEPS